MVWSGALVSADPLMAAIDDVPGNPYASHVDEQ